MKMTNKELYSPQVGFYAPLFESRELGSGRMYSLVTHKGRYTLIDFWGSWCLPCLKELPALKSVYDQADTARIGFLSVAVDDTAEDVMKIIRTQSISWPQIISDKLAALYNVNSFPSNFLLDPSGKIIAKDIKMDELKKFLAGLNTTTDE